METGIFRGGSFDASLEIALEICKFFNMNGEDSERFARQASLIIAEGWKQAVRDEGAPSGKVRVYERAFEHEDLGRTSSLGE